MIISAASRSPSQNPPCPATTIPITTTSRTSSQASRFAFQPPFARHSRALHWEAMAERRSEPEPERAEEDLALLEALGVPGAPQTLCECGHSWEWHRAPEAMG